MSKFPLNDVLREIAEVERDLMEEKEPEYEYWGWRKLRARERENTADLLDALAAMSHTSNLITRQAFDYHNDDWDDALSLATAHVDRARAELAKALNALKEGC